jgi:hypothetical protein
MVNAEGRMSMNDIMEHFKVLLYIMWRMDPLLGRDLEANKGTAAVAVEQR